MDGALPGMSIEDSRGRSDGFRKKLGRESSRWRHYALELLVAIHTRINLAPGPEEREYSRHPRNPSDAGVIENGSTRESARSRFGEAARADDIHQS
jgi:hypothetical protein